MGAPTGSLEVRSVTRPRDSIRSGPAPLTPVMVTVAGRSTERRLISDQVSASGVHVCAALWLGVRAGGRLVGAMQRGSISPMVMSSPGDFRCRGEPPAKET